MFPLHFYLHKMTKPLWFCLSTTFYNWQCFHSTSQVCISWHKDKRMCLNYVCEFSRAHPDSWQHLGLLNFPYYYSFLRTFRCQPEYIGCPNQIVAFPKTLFIISHLCFTWLIERQISSQLEVTNVSKKLVRKWTNVSQNNLLCSTYVRYFCSTCLAVILPLPQLNAVLIN